MDVTGKGLRRGYMRRLVLVLHNSRRIKRAKTVWARCRAIKLAADLSLALAFKGRTAWSQAIIKKYLRRRGDFCSLKETLKAKQSTLASPCPEQLTRGWKKKVVVAVNVESEDEEEYAVASRLHKLKSIVPGGNELETPDLLNEAAGYIAALQIQVETMRMLANLCSSSSNL